MSKSRFEAFSDGVMAIVITIMALNIPLPEDFTGKSIMRFAYTIMIFFVSFVVVGAQWTKHHWLFDACNEVSQKVIWRNILYLFFLTLLPLFTKWIMENPKEVAPAIAYDLVYLAVFFTFHLMHSCVMKESGIILGVRPRRRQINWAGLFLMIIVLGTAAILALSFFFPTLSIIFFVALPVVSSLLNLWSEKEHRAIEKRKKNIARLSANL